MKKFEVSGFKWSAGEIKEIEIERETAAFVWVKGRRHAKETSYERIFDDWDSAHRFLNDVAIEQVDAARNKLAIMEDRLQKVWKMQKP